jgi:hypothetical protein
LRWSIECLHGPITIGIVHERGTPDANQPLRDETLIIFLYTEHVPEYLMWKMSEVTIEGGDREVSYGAYISDQLRFFKFNLAN